MGIGKFQLDLEGANILAYLSLPRATLPRDTMRWERIMAFLGDLEASDDVFSHRSDWVTRIRTIAAEGIKHIENSKIFRTRSSNYISTQDAERALLPLRDEVMRFTFIGLAISKKPDPELRAFAEYAAYSSGPQGLLIIASAGNLDDSEFTLRDPTEPLSYLINNKINWPGILFWSPKTGSFAFIKKSKLNTFYAQLLQCAENSQVAVDRLLLTSQEHNNQRKILHLSDLHFGQNEVAENESFNTQLSRMKDKYDRIIITGDLFDNPSRRDFVDFSRFRDGLQRLTNKEIVVIPGNHDVRWKGNALAGLGVSLAQVAELEWSSVVVDEELQTIFACFNSAESGNFARGEITAAQLRDMGNKLDLKYMAAPETEKYIRIALVHHHPFAMSWEEKDGEYVQRNLKGIEPKGDLFLAMNRASEFTSWCARRGFYYILHGHKHLQRLTTEHISLGHPSYREVTAVGCGASLGVHAAPLSFNILSFNDAGLDMVSFYSDPGDGSGFVPQEIHKKAPMWASAPLP